MYDPSIGRWLEEDPIGFNGGDPNLYRYVGNNYPNARDPSGQFIFATGEETAVATVHNLEHRYPGVEAGAIKLDRSWSEPLFVIFANADAPRIIGQRVFDPIDQLWASAILSPTQHFWSGGNVLGARDEEFGKTPYPEPPVPDWVIAQGLETFRQRGFEVVERPFLDRRNAPVSAVTSTILAASNLLGNVNNGWFAQVSNAGAGFADTVSGNMTQRMRQAFNFDAVDYDSGAYGAGAAAGQVYNVALMVTPAGAVGWAASGLRGINAINQVGSGFDAAEALFNGNYVQAAVILGVNAQGLRRRPANTGAMHAVNPNMLRGGAATAAARGLGYTRRIPANKAPFNSHGQPVFRESGGNRYITPDADGHNGGIWKMFDRNGNRLGTYDANLIRIGD